MIVYKTIPTAINNIIQSVLQNNLRKVASMVK